MASADSLGEPDSPLPENVKAQQQEVDPAAAPPEQKAPSRPTPEANAEAPAPTPPTRERAPESESPPAAERPVPEQGASELPAPDRSADNRSALGPDDGPRGDSGGTTEKGPDETADGANGPGATEGWAAGGDATIGEDVTAAGEGVTNGRVDGVPTLKPSRYVAPEYPEVARHAGWTGTVVAELTIGRRGRVAEAEIVESSRHDPLDQAALRAVRLWRFPRRKAESRSLHRFEFRLE